MIVFKEVTREQMQLLEVEMCTLCVYCGIVVDCAKAYCMPHQRSDNKLGYYVKTKEIKNDKENSNVL